MHQLTLKVIRTANACSQFKDFICNRNRDVNNNNISSAILYLEEGFKLVQKLLNHQSITGSYTSYIDPRLISLYCIKHDISIELFKLTFGYDLPKWAWEHALEIDDYVF